MNTERIDIYKTDKNYYSPLIELDSKLKSSSLTTTELLLIYIKASQINGCAFCIQSHIKEAIERGEKQYRIHALLAWGGSPFFTDEERVILKITEEITLISNGGLSDTTYNKATELFDETKVSDIVMAVTCINAWNRIGRATLLTPNKSQN